VKYFDRKMWLGSGNSGRPARHRLRKALRRRVKKVAARKAILRWGVEDSFVVYESSIEPKHFTVEQIRRAVKAVIDADQSNN